MTEPEEKYADKIRKLLDKAESASGPEAEAFFERAAQLMSRYAIDEAMIAAARGLTTDELVKETFQYTGIYRIPGRQLGINVATHFGLKCVVGSDRRPVGGGALYLPLHVVGWKSDVERFRLLDTSLQLQCATAHAAWWKDEKDDLHWASRGDQFRTRRDFVFGFARGVDVKLTSARRAAKAEAVSSQAERTHADQADAQVSVDLVLVDRSKKVDEFYDEVWGGNLRRSRSRTYQRGAGDGFGSGHSAGRNANTATTGIGGRRALGR